MARNGLELMSQLPYLCLVEGLGDTAVRLGDHLVVGAILHPDLCGLKAGLENLVRLAHLEVNRCVAWGEGAGRMAGGVSARKG